MAKVYHNETWEDCVPRVLKDVAGTFTALPITISTDRNALVDYKIYGNTGGVGDKTINLFDESKAEMIRYRPTTAETRYGINFGILPAGAYTINFNHIGSQSLILTFLYSNNYSDENITDKSPYTFTIQGNAEIIIRTQSNILTTFSNMGFTNIMLTEGSTAPASFVPYGYEVDISTSDGTNAITTPIYIGNEPLDKINRYTDYVDYASQKIVRSIKKYVLTGDENWEEISGSTASSTYFRWIFAPMYYCVRHMLRCSHFIQTSITTSTTNVGVDVFDSSSVRGEVLAIRPAGVESTTLADFKAWLAGQYAAGTPVTVWCALTTAEETDPPVSLPEIPTAGGTTIIDYNGTPKPSSVTVIYHGWHEQQELIRSNDEWTVPNTQLNALQSPLSFTPIDENEDTEEGGEDYEFER